MLPSLNIFNALPKSEGLGIKETIKGDNSIKCNILQIEERCFYFVLICDSRRCFTILEFYSGYV